MVTLTIKDGLAPLLKLKPEQRKEALGAAGMAVLALAQRAFHEENLRPIAWVPRKDSKPHLLLIKEGNNGGLVGSLAVSKLSSSSVYVGTDKKYGAIHQYGGPIKGKKSKKKKQAQKTVGQMPARPYLPFYNGALTEKAATRIKRVVEIKMQKWVK